VIGYGLGGSTFHAPLIAVTDGLLLEAIVTSNPERQSEARDRYPDARIVPTVRELFETVHGLDLAVVTVPNADHVAVAEETLEAGVSAVIDKPLAPTAEEAERLGAIADKAGLRVIPYHNRRWDGDFRTLRALLDEGRLGEPWRLESRFERWRPGPESRPWKRDPGLAGGGILYDLGPHLIDQALVLFGRPVSVYAELANRNGKLDDDVFLALEYPGDLSIHVWASSKAAQIGPRFRALGSVGGFVKYGLDPQEDALRAGRLPTEPGWGTEPERAWGLLGTADGAEPIETLPGAYQDFYRAVAATLLDGSPQPVALDDAVAGLRVVEAARRSAATGQAVLLG
jgi:scyllo-inositol 2-dehydrogenase (NADP+)